MADYPRRRSLLFDEGFLLARPVSLPLGFSLMTSLDEFDCTWENGGEESLISPILPALGP